MIILFRWVVASVEALLQMFVVLTIVILYKNTSKKVFTNKKVKIDRIMGAFFICVAELQLFQPLTGCLRFAD